MKPGLGYLLAWRAFRARTGASGGSFLLSSSLALALGLLPLVVVLSVADGMIDAIASRTIETSLSHFQVWPLVGGLEQSPAESLQSLPGFRAARAEQQGFALAYTPTARTGVSLRGVDPHWAEDPGVARFLKATSGALTFPTLTSLWIGKETARKLGLRVGDELRLLTTRTGGAVTLPRITKFRVQAIVSVGYQELDRLWVFLPLAETQILLDPWEHPVFWGVKFDRPLSETATTLEQVRNTLGPEWQAASWETLGRSQFLNYQATRWLLLIVMTLILLVSAVNISTSMVTMVQQRRRETAILKALGSPLALVRRQFVVLGLLCGVTGTVVGMACGVIVALMINQILGAVQAVSMGISALSGWFHGAVVDAQPVLDPNYYLESLPVKFDIPLLTGIAVGTVFLAVVASTIPALQAARQRPLDVLRRV